MVLYLYLYNEESHSEKNMTQVKHYMVKVTLSILHVVHNILLYLALSVHHMDRPKCELFYNAIYKSYITPISSVLILMSYVIAVFDLMTINRYMLIIRIKANHCKANNIALLSM